MWDSCCESDHTVTIAALLCNLLTLPSCYRGNLKGSCLTFGVFSSSSGIEGLEVGGGASYIDMPTLFWELV